MKKVLIKFPVAKANEIADIMGINGFVNLVSWSESGALFDNVIKMYVAYDSAKEDTVLARFQTYIQKS